MKALSFALPLFAVILAWSGPARAWGPLGHQIVAELAARELDPVARREVERLLGDRAGPAMREASTWADEVRRDPNQPRSGDLHFVNFPRNSCAYSPRRQCPGGRCLVGAIETFVIQLRDARDDESRREALKWLIHLVADAHQPLHAGYGDDRGGNDLQLRFHGKGTNLHALLDSGLLADRRLKPLDYVTALSRELPEPTPAQARYDAQAPQRWIEDLCRTVAGVYPDDGRIDATYAERTRQLLEVQLRLAGARLATLLNFVLDPASR